MAEDLFKQFAEEAVLAGARVAFDRGVEIGRQQGIEIGKVIGFVAAMDSVKAAISDGTRHGSSECARALESMKRIGAIPEVEPSDGDHFVTHVDDLDE